jgi:predicted Zn-dependent protease with MMP-like domain
MKREHFVKVVEEALDSLPQKFRSRIKNVAILVEDFPPNQSPPQPGQQRRLLLGIFHGVPDTKTPKIRLSIGGERFDGNARFLTDRAEHERAMAAIRRKYWIFRPL